MSAPAGPTGYAVIDLETTGFGSADRIIEIGVVLLRADLAVEGTWETLVQPGRSIHNTFVHRISAFDVKTAPRFEEIAADLGAVLQGRIPVAHDASFEKRFLKSEYARLGVDTAFTDKRWLDTSELAEDILGASSLEDALRKASLTNHAAHSALGDAEAATKLLRYLAYEHKISAAGYDPVVINTIGAPRHTSLLQRGGRRSEGVESTRSAAGADWIARLIKNSPGDTTIQAPGTDRYRTVLEEALEDQELTDDELTALKLTAAADGLTEEELTAIHAELFRELSVEAWMDGVITASERETMTTLATRLGLEPEVIDEVLAAPVAEIEGPEIELAPGDRVSFSGLLNLPRDAWKARVARAGLTVGDVNEATRVLVTADPEANVGKTQRARALGVAVVSEAQFDQMMSRLDSDLGLMSGEDEEPDTPGTTNRWARFTWLDPANIASNLTAAGVAAAWIDQHPGRPLSEMSDLLDPDRVLEITRSSVEKAAGKWEQRFPRMLDASVNDLQDLPGVGGKRLLTLVEGVVLAALDSDDPNAPAVPAEEPAANRHERTEDTEAIPEMPPLAAGLNRSFSDTLREMYAVAGWFELTHAAFADGNTTESLPQMRAAVQGGTAVRALFEECVAELERACGDDDRLRTIASKRLLGNGTLEELGKELNLTRERVRQLETKILETFNAANGFSDAVSKILAGKIGQLNTRDIVEEQIPTLFEDSVFGVTYGKYFSVLFERWSMKGQWFTAAGFERAAHHAMVAHRNGYGAVRIADVAADVMAEPVMFAQWLDQVDGLLVLFGAEFVIADTNHQDRAVAVLSIADEPLTAGQIAEAIGRGVNVRSMTNAMNNEDRIVRVANSLYALRDWGLEEFSSVNEWIGKQVDRAGGQLSLKTLVDTALKKRVSPQAVYSYANGVHFKVVDGIVSRADKAVERVEADPQDSRDMYLRDGEWHMLLTVTEDHLRGTGFPVPRGVPGIYNAKVDSAVAIPSRLGPHAVRVNRLRQPTLSPIRGFLVDIGAEPGDRVWLKFGADLDDPEAFDVIPALPARYPVVIEDEDGAPPAHLDGVSDWELLLDRMGLDPDLASDKEKAKDAISAALGVDRGVPRRRVVAIFGHRRQDDLAQLVRDL